MRIVESAAIYVFVRILKYFSKGRRWGSVVHHIGNGMDAEDMRFITNIYYIGETKEYLYRNLGLEQTITQITKPATVEEILSFVGPESHLNTEPGVKRSASSAETK